MVLLSDQRYRATPLSWWTLHSHKLLYTPVKGGHPSGNQYTPFIGTIITPLPDAVCDRLRRRAPAGCQSVESAASSDVATFLDTHRGTSRYGALADRRRTVAKAVEGARHHTAQTQLVLGYREAIAGYYPAQAVHDALQHALTDSGWDGARFDSEWAGMNAWAIGQVQHLTADAARSEISEALGDILTGNLDDTYPAEYVDALDADHGRELPIDELDRLIAAQDQTGATDYDDDARGVVTFRSIPEPFMVPTLDWLAKGLISHPTHGELAGPEKALKSHVGLAIDVGLAAGVDVLSQWPVPQPISVLVLVGEGGEATFLRRLDRACTGYGISIEDIRPTFRYTTQTAPVSSRPFREGLQQALDQHQPDLVHLDPWYSYAPTDTDARNLYETGAALDQIGALVRDGGASLIINNHFNQTGTGHGLRRISMAGHAEWCDSWWLLDHREPPDVTRGRFRLRLDVGSRQWGGRAFHVDFDTGRFNLDTNEHDGQMKWTVTHAAADPGTETDATKIAEGKKLIIQSWKRRRGPDRHQPLSQRAWIHRSPGVSAVHLRTAFAELLNNGRIQGIETTIEDASKRTRRGTLYQLV